MTPGVLSRCQRDGARTSRRPRPTPRRTWRRRGFAEWLVSPDNPLTARVMVNRLWQHHFGEGIVRTPSNFGKMGEPPSHPELLDWLAVEFVERGWSLKAMHRLMLTSDAYQMVEPRHRRPTSRSIPRTGCSGGCRGSGSKPRLSATSILATAGTLDRTLGGPNVFPYIDPDLFEVSSKRNWPGKPDDDPSTWRRSLYVFSKRSIRYPLFEAFDQPNLINSVDRRNRSTVAPQALLLMNNAFVLSQSQQFAERLQREAGADAGAQVDRAFRIALARPPDATERQQAVAFVRQDGLACVLPRPLQPERVRLPPMSDRCCSEATDLLLSRRELISPPGRRHRRSRVRRSAGAQRPARARGQSKNPLAPKPQNFPAKAKAIISIFCYGGVSQVDTFDPKPALLKYQGETMQGVGEVRTVMGTPGGLMPSPWKFKKHGQSGMEVSELFPHVAEACRRSRADPVDALAEPGARPGALPDEHRQHPGRASERRQLGDATVSAARTRTCPDSSCSPIIAAARSTARRTGATATCRRPTRASSSAIPARRSST